MTLYRFAGNHDGLPIASVVDAPFGSIDVATER
jgi:hypothetical protein